MGGRFKDVAKFQVRAFVNTLKMALRYLWMPGSDLFTRRRVRLEKYWIKGERQVLDAGFGNGWFSWRAFRSGATVTAVALPQELVDKATPFYNGFLGAPENRLNFRQMDLYDLDSISQTFDEIICYETLEHIRDDERICRSFFAALKPGGVLHLCCPNAEHPRWLAEELDREERGGHVRHGYTEPSYRALLERLGFRIETAEGVGGPALVYWQETMQAGMRKWFGEAGAFLATLLALPLIALDADGQPKTPFSIYVKAVKDA